MRRLAVPLLVALLAATVAAPAASAAPVVQRVWHAYLGSGAVHGREFLTAYTDGTAQLSLQLKAMRANTSYTVGLYSGSCSRLGTRLAAWSGFRTGATGAATGTRSLDMTTMNRVWPSGRSGSLVIRFVAGSSVACGGLAYYHATRVRFPYLRIDLAVVKTPSGYPYCNVAMYQTQLSQPAEPGATFIFAHARTGMFLPILTASKVNNGAAMLGKLVYVYTDNSMVYTYRITQVRRHVATLAGVFGVTGSQLWLQTSEGPNFTYPKVIVIANRIAAARATYAASHPTPRIVYCR